MATPKPFPADNHAISPSSERPVVLVAEHLGKRYRTGQQDIVALQDVSLRVLAGEFIVLLGPSGSGKSTLLNILGGLDRPSSGHARFAEHDLSEADDAALTRYRREHVGFVFQFHHLLPELTALENVLMPAMKTKSDLHHRDYALKLLEDFGLKDKAGRFPTQLSGGEQQMLAIGRALMSRPMLLLMDEPTTGMDFRHQLEILNVLKDLRSSGLAIVVVLHDLNLTARIADKVALLASGLKEGKSLMAYGTPEDVLNKELLQCAFAVNVESCLNEKGDRIYYFEPL